MPGWGLVILIAIAAIFLFLYFLPLLIAVGRDHQNSFEIFMLTLFTGWTLIGWIAALVWSLTAVQPRIVSTFSERVHRD